MVTQSSKERNTRRIIYLWGLIVFLVPNLLSAQEFPTKPINMLVGFSPGSGMDLIARLMTSKAQQVLKQPFIISNNAAGGQSVALSIVAKQIPDGYHLIACGSSGLVRIPQFRTVSYKLEEFVPIMHMGVPPTMTAVRADAPWKTLKEFVEYAKKNPGKVNYSAPGTGTPHHLAMEYIARQEGIQWTLIPVGGGPSVVTAVLGGNVSACSGSTEVVAHVKEGSVRLLATHGERRYKTFPDVPTLRELGYDFYNDSVLMYAAPKGTPPSIVNKLDDAFRRVMDDSEFLQLMERISMEVIYRNSEDTRKYLEEAYVRLGKMIIELKIPKESEN